jgi:hypothetical protein
LINAKKQEHSKSDLRRFGIRYITAAENVNNGEINMIRVKK